MQSVTSICLLRSTNPWTYLTSDGRNHVVKIEKYLKKKVTERAAVVITRDHSWGVEFGGVSGGSGFHYDVAGQEDFASWKS